eukprot:TRINITY_DN47533_c0_g1_i2.p1 TRINITY_DN47533_c0_g1~~TRINITY_DN47533_c0_g1_i2.p1  ORF type:complete len:309 (-),score=20.17 TRINITY_DN47533_c0_g1_i2:88-1014(-)
MPAVAARMMVSRRALLTAMCQCLLWDCCPTLAKAELEVATTTSSDSSHVTTAATGSTGNNDRVPHRGVIRKAPTTAQNSSTHKEAAGEVTVSDKDAAPVADAAKHPSRTESNDGKPKDGLDEKTKVRLFTAQGLGDAIGRLLVMQTWLNWTHSWSSYEAADDLIDQCVDPEFMMPWYLVFACCITKIAVTTLVLGPEGVRREESRVKKVAKGIVQFIFLGMFCVSLSKDIKRLNHLKGESWIDMYRCHWWESFVSFPFSLGRASPGRQPSSRICRRRQNYMAIGCRSSLLSCGTRGAVHWASVIGTSM